MAMPSAAGQAILRELVDHISAGRVRADDPRTFIGYKQIHDALQLPRRAETFGDSLKVQGLAELAEWTKRERHPAITGLIVDQISFLPGNGYFELFEKENPDFQWWQDEIRRSLVYDWQPFLDSATPTNPPPPPTPNATDLLGPPDRVLAAVYRILRDTELARRVKGLHGYECQVCGHTIELPDGSRYAEAHHIQPLGSPHNGPDAIGNILCLCPNHHAELDYGAIPLSLASLRCHEQHIVEQAYIDYHNRDIYSCG